MFTMRKRVITAVLFSLFVILAVAPAGCLFAPPVVNGPRDTAGDLFDKNGAAVTGAEYLDITAVDAQKTGDNYTFLMQLNGDIPSTIAGSDTYDEWAFFIDADTNAKTGTTWSLLDSDIGFDLVANDIGYEYIVRFGLNKNTRIFDVFNTKTGEHTAISGNITGNVISLTVPASAIGDATGFNWTAAVREFPAGLNSATPSVSDKAPDYNHFSFPATAAAPVSAYKGTLNGTWDYKLDTTNPFYAAMPQAQNGTLSLTIYADGSVQGFQRWNTYAANGILAGNVDADGNITLSGFYSSGPDIPKPQTFSGVMTKSGTVLSMQGSYSFPFKIGGATFMLRGTFAADGKAAP